jgi:hypothetical protein
LRADEIPAEEMEFGIETIEDSAVDIPDEIEVFEMVEEDVAEEDAESKTEENTDEQAGEKAADSSDESEAVAAGEENKEN